MKLWRSRAGLSSVGDVITILVLLIRCSAIVKVGKPYPHEISAMNWQDIILGCRIVPGATAGPRS